MKINMAFIIQCLLTCKMLTLCVLLRYTWSPRLLGELNIAWVIWKDSFVPLVYSCGESHWICCRIWPYLIHQSPWLFLISVDEISMRNFSSGMEMNMSLSTSGMSKSSRTFDTSTIHSIRWPLLFSFFFQMCVKKTSMLTHTLKSPSIFRPPTRKVVPVLLQSRSISSILL